MSAKPTQKRVAAIHDLSCFGRCSLTVALPILSAAGVETPVIPTAVLSTHTGGFEGFTFRDLTEDIPKVSAHWQALALEFDAIYTGFLGSFEQINIVSEIFDRLGKNGSLILVDPVMADNGELYKIFSPEFARGMAKLCEKADILVPNLTEAALILDEPYRQGPYTADYIESLLKRLSALGPEKVVLTGVFFDEDTLGAAAYDRGQNSVSYAFAERVPGYYHGTGDVFASALLGALMNGISLPDSAKAAVDFTVASIKKTRKAGSDLRFGVNFEQSIPGYLKAIGLTE